MNLAHESTDELRSFEPPVTAQFSIERCGKSSVAAGRCCELPHLLIDDRREMIRMTANFIEDPVGMINALRTEIGFRICHRPIAMTAVVILLMELEIVAFSRIAICAAPHSHRSVGVAGEDRRCTGFGMSRRTDSIEIMHRSRIVERKKAHSAIDHLPNSLIPRTPDAARLSAERLMTVDNGVLQTVRRHQLFYTLSCAARRESIRYR